MRHVSELQKLLYENLNWNRARISCLAQILQALILVRTVNLSQISIFFKNSSKSESSYRRIRRFFSHFYFDRTIIIPIVLALFNLDKDLVLILDRTNWKWGNKDINILLISVAYQGIGIPIFWQVSSSAGSSSTKDRKEIIKTILAKIGVNRIRVFLADREFVGCEWFSYLNKKKIPFIIRIKKNSQAGGIQNCKKVPVIELWNKKTDNKAILNHAVVIGSHFLFLSISKAPSAKEPLIVVSNFKFVDAVTLYLRRWEIETLFGCLKTRGFRLEDTHMTNPERIEKLLFILAIAFAWSYKLGDIANAKKSISKKTHGRLAKSLFKTGLDQLQEILKSVEVKFEAFLSTINLFRTFRIV